MSSFGHENIRRFDVTVNDAFGVRCIQPIGDFNSEREQKIQIQSSSRYVMFQRHSIQNLHRNEGLPLLVVDFVDSADVRMIQGLSRFGFTLESGQGLRIVCNIIRQELKGNKPTELYIFCLINYAHPATAKLLQDSVVR